MKSATRSWALIGAVLFIAFIAGVNIGMYAMLHGSQLALPEATTSRISYEKTAESRIMQESHEGLASPSNPTIVPSTTPEPPRSPPGPPQTSSNPPSRAVPSADTISIARNSEPIKLSTSPPEKKEVTLNSGLETRERDRLEVKGPIGAYIAAGFRIPILMVTCNRPELLKTTLNSLLATKGVKSSDVIVIQDGSLQSVADIVTDRGLKLIQNTEGLRLRGGIGSDGGSRIAMHYKFSLSRVFAEVPDAPAVIIVEDDLLFSPDFYEYFHTIGPILDVDKTVFALSAWNDNGFEGKVNDPFKLLRTNYFPGLGWMLSRDLYMSELEPRWPSSHWDHWLRSMDINKGREVVHPEVFNLLQA
jgi:hypothetical protein